MFGKRSNLDSKFVERFALIRFSTKLDLVFSPNLNYCPVEDHKSNGREEIYSQKVKAGKRMYFFDVKATRNNDYYITITESKKRFNHDGEGFTYEKHKIFLYKEDFNKFLEAINNIVGHVKTELMPGIDFSQFDQPREAEDDGFNAAPPRWED